MRSRAADQVRLVLRHSIRHVRAYSRGGCIHPPSRNVVLDVLAPVAVLIIPQRMSDGRLGSRQIRTFAERRWNRRPASRVQLA